MPTISKPSTSTAVPPCHLKISSTHQAICGALRPEEKQVNVAGASQLAATLSEMAHGSGIPDSTHSQIANILLASGSRKMAKELSIDTMSIADGEPTVMYIPWEGQVRRPFGVAPDDEPGSVSTIIFWAHSATPAGLEGILADDAVRSSAQELQIEGQELQEATALFGSCTPSEWTSWGPQTVLSSAIRRPKGYAHGLIVCGTISSKLQHYKAEFRDTRKEPQIVARRGVERTLERRGFHAGHCAIKGIAVFTP